MGKLTYIGARGKLRESSVFVVLADSSYFISTPVASLSPGYFEIMRRRGAKYGFRVTKLKEKPYQWKPITTKEFQKQLDTLRSDGKYKRRI